MEDKRYRLTRDVTPDECRWLDRVVPRGAVVWECKRFAYGVIGDGASVCWERGRRPAFELPWDALEEAD